MTDDPTKPAPARSLLRPADADARVGNAELFFDLVSAFAITQISHQLLARHDLVGVAQTAVLFLAVWWAWVLMVWTTNWVDPDRPQVRILIFLVMLALLFMSASLPTAFGAGGPAFALAYLAAHIGRMVWLWRVVRVDRPQMAENLKRTLGWWALSAPLWLGGALAPPGARLALWAAGVALNIATPYLTFATPWSRRVSFESFAVAGHHFAERCSLLIIIALGEYILMGAAAFAETPWTPAAVASYVVGFCGSVTLWWIYFDVGMERGADHIGNRPDNARLARDVYSLLHIPIVAGVVISAVADEHGLKHPLEPADALFVWTSLTGPMLFLAGAMVFKRETSGRPWLPLSHLVGLALLTAILGWALWSGPSSLAIAVAILAALTTVCVWEWGSFHGGWVERGVPLPAFLRRRAERRLAEHEAKQAKEAADKAANAP